MQKSGRLILVQSVLAATPVYYLMAEGLPAWAIKEIESIQRKFLWAGKDPSVRGKCAVAWKVVASPKEYTFPTQREPCSTFRSEWKLEMVIVPCFGRITGLVGGPLLI